MESVAEMVNLTQSKNEKAKTQRELPTKENDAQRRDKNNRKEIIFILRENVEKFTVCHGANA